jgi:hypothetical protein
MTDSDAAETVLLPISEAASRLGLSTIALRSRVRRGSIPSRRGNAGQILVEVPANAATHAGKVAGTSADAVVLADLEAEVDALRRELAHAQGERDAASAIAAAKVEAAERIVAELRADRDRETARADRFEAELAQARKGWLERLLEALRRR